MQNAKRYREQAAKCLLAAQSGSARRQKLQLSMATTWLNLARHEEAIDALFSEWDTEDEEAAIGHA